MRAASRAPTLLDAWDGGRNHFHLIRLIAAWLVIWSHAWAITGTAGNDHFARLTLSRSAGAFAVDVFFVISGFLVAASVQRHPWREFLLARALRLYPALIVCVALTVVVLGPLLTTAPEYWSDPRTWRYLWANATLWRAEFWLPGVFETLPRTAINGSLWTLPIEGRLYLALFLAALLGMLRPWRYLPAWALAMAGAVGFALLRGPLPEHLVYLIWVTAAASGSRRRISRPWPTAPSASLSSRGCRGSNAPICPTACISTAGRCSSSRCSPARPPCSPTPSPRPRWR
jgi:peptidoglycan/LPS O-acetylase OafA/YrhL